MRRTTVLGGLASRLLVLFALAVLQSQAMAQAPSPQAEAASAQLRQRIVPGFEEPLVAAGPSSPAEDAALDAAIARYRSPALVGRDIAERGRPYAEFLAAHPSSAWRVSLLTNLGIEHYRDGYFTKAMEAWRAAWVAGKDEQGLAVRALTDRAMGELARMHARIGHSAELEALFAEIGDRPLSGAATEMLAGAREGLWMFRNEPGLSFLCGPKALQNLLVTLKSDPKTIRALDAERSGPRGYSLAQVAQLAERAGLDHQLIVRKPGQPVPVPSIINWKLNHYAAIIDERDGRYRISDPTFASGDLWVTKAAIDAEGSGYFLVPAKATNLVWRQASAEEAGRVYGMGFTSTNESPKEGDPSLNKGCGKGMCVVDVKLSSVSLSLNDMPVGYTPARGPSVRIKLSYNQREAGQPAVFSFFNVSPKWSMNFMAWVQDNPNIPGQSVFRFTGGGGFIDYTTAPYFYNSATGQFSPERQGQAVLVRIPATGPLSSYELRMPDGSKQVYAKLDGATSSPRRVFLTSVVDPAGNALTLSYDAQLRLTTITDAVGRNTVLTYGATSPLLVTRITDPFGRFASLAYDGNGRLTSITDVIGLQSAFTYDTSGLINAMTTPYGTSNFAYGSSGTTRFVEIRDPLGLRERVEFQHTAPGMPYADPVAPPGFDNIYLYYRNTFYWDKTVYPLTGIDYSKAQITHFLHTLNGQTSSIIESTKAPLERRVWFKYPNQGSGLSEGSTGTPIAIARVLDDGTTQQSSFTYNAFGLPLTVTDPLGRRTFFTYAGNDSDILRIEQQVTTGGARAQLAAFTYNGQHKPLTYTDAAGATTRYAYNSAGQLTSLTDALGKTTSFVYDSLGRLSSITNPNGAVQESRTYDAADRVATRTDSEGHTVTYSYDAFDRLTQVAYPDGTTTQYGYTRLDLTSVKDRLNRVTSYGYDANRRLVSVTDPLARTTSYTYFGNGTLRSITDPKNNTTAWDVDLQSRPIAKRFANGTAEIYSYEGATSRLRTTRDALNQIRTLGYFNDDQLKSIAYAGAVNPTAGVSFSYDPFFPRRTAMVDGLGTTSWTYHPVGSPGAMRLAGENGPYAANDSVSYSYDALGRLTSRSVDAAVESFSYDNLDRLIAHTGALGTFNLAYLGQTSQLTSRLAASGVVGTEWLYDTNANDRRLRTIKNSGQARSFGFTSLPENLITGGSESLGTSVQKSWTYGYDNASRLLSATPSSGAPSSYAYDGADNLISIASNGASRSASYNNLNQITSLGGTPYVYDAAGNLVDDGIRTYGWDAENRLIAIGYKGVPGKQTTMRYDGLGRRLAIIDTAITGTLETRYLWCGDSLCQARSNTDAVTRRYFGHGVAYPQTGALLYYGQDQLGSVRDVTAVQTGAKLGGFDYDPYGDVSAVAGRTALDFRYAGMLYHGTSGLYLTNYRAYDGKTGRWQSRDPIAEEGGMNLYAYVGGNSLSYTDPRGLYAGIDDAIFSIGGAVVGLIGQGVSDVLGGQMSGWEDYTGAAIGGAAGGEALLYTGPIGAGLVAGATTNATKQLLKNLSGKQCGYNATSFVADTAVGGLTGLIPGARISGVTAGRGSWNSIFRQMSTKFSNGAISNVSAQTALKMAGGRAVDTAVVPGMAAGSLAGTYAEPYIPGYGDSCTCPGTR